MPVYLQLFFLGRELPGPDMALSDLLLDEFLQGHGMRGDFGSSFRSAIAFGKARIVNRAEEKRRALQLLMEKYSGRSFEFSEREIERVAILEIRVEEVTGKRG